MSVQSEFEKVKKDYSLTPKGFLVGQMALRHKIDPAEGSRLWNDLAEFVKKLAAENGMEEGVACLVFADGGHCITAGKRKREEEADAGRG